MAKPAKLTRALAEDMAIAALTFIAQDSDRLGRFLALSGLDLLDLFDRQQVDANHDDAPRGARCRPYRVSPSVRSANPTAIQAIGA